MANDNMSRDLVLAPGEFAFVLDTTKGLVNTVVGPNKVSMSNTDQPVVWDKKQRRFVNCDAERAKQINTIAPEGYYIALYNPAESTKDGKLELISPREGASSVSIPLNVGHRVNIPGPVHFPLWPGQMTNVIQGHHLRSNQYVLAQVYNDLEATKNWKSAVLKPQGDAAAVTPTPQSFTPGQLIIIKGTDVAFFIPPTGVKVVPEITNGVSTFVREAVTLERLEYCILLDEDGNKRFVKGPDVVFPEPTETFVEKDGKRKFLAIELNETSGIYIKVIADYTENGKEYKAGEELFITGKEQAIYFQREEHSVIRYGDQTKHYAVAIPAGEGRYVLDRLSGEITLERGPQMLLCDPRRQVIVRRVLAQSTAALWYPGNTKILQINQELEDIEAAAMPMASPGVGSAGASVAYSASQALRSSSLMAMNYTDDMAIRASRQVAGDTIQRGTKFTPPRTVTLDTKYEGAVSLSVWTGYAVLKIRKTGERKVVVGPENILLEYDETLAPLELSTGHPKTDAKLFRTVYLRVHNNRVSDTITVETKDLVKVTLQISYLVNFEGNDQEKWFEVENYVKLLCDHMRSMIRNLAKRTGIEDFYGNAISIIRDLVLGVAAEGKRPGRAFEENGMRVYDLEVLDVAIDDKNIATLLSKAQTTALQSAIEVNLAEQALKVTLRTEEIKRQTADAKAQTAVHGAESAKLELGAEFDKLMTKITNEATAEATKLKNKENEIEVQSTIHNANLARQKAADDLRIETRRQEIELELKRIVGETEEVAKRAGAVSPTLAAALTTFSDNALVEKISIALAPMAAMNGVSAADVLAKLFKGTPFEGVMTTLGTRSRMPILQD